MQDFSSLGIELLKYGFIPLSFSNANVLSMEPFPLV